MKLGAESLKLKELPRIKTGDLVSHRRHGFGHVVDIWDGNIYDVIFIRNGCRFRHSRHRSYLLKVNL
jgi:hypothetical protein